MGSTRLPGKALADVGGRPLIAWTIAAASAVSSIDDVVVATTTDPSDDVLVGALAGMAARIAVHRGSVDDVLGRCWDAVRPLRPAVVVRLTADNPFVDPDVVEAQVRLRDAGGWDYVGARGWPLGIGGEVVRAAALEVAADEATDPAEREHVLPFVTGRPGRFRVTGLDAPPHAVHGRYTVDTDADLAFARAAAAGLGHGPPVRLGELEAVIAREPGLRELNAGVEQRQVRVETSR